MSRRLVLWVFVLSQLFTAIFSSAVRDGLAAHHSVLRLDSLEDRDVPEKSGAETAESDDLHGAALAAPNQFPYPEDPQVSLRVVPSHWWSTESLHASLLRDTMSNRHLLIHRVL